MSNQEQERLRRLREEQLQARDPQVKQRKVQRNISTKEKRMRRSFSLAQAWGDIPHIVKTPLYGLLLGIVIAILLPTFWASPYITLASGGAIIILMIFGLALGNALDVRDNIKDSIK
ncbi:MAG TPA: hypothetical protein PLF42_10770 [Anaerolineales bacterium]|nr:hypothetical protein [Anaerolineales bacterium]